MFGGVRFELTKPAQAAGCCHCTRCQRRTGAAVSAPGGDRRRHFRERNWSRPGVIPTAASRNASLSRLQGASLHPQSRAGFLPVHQSPLKHVGIVGQFHAHRRRAADFPQYSDAVAAVGGVGVCRQQRVPYHLLRVAGLRQLPLEVGRVHRAVPVWSQITLSINAVVDLQLVQAVLDRLSLGQQRALLGCRAALLSPVRQLGRRLRRHHLLECRSRRGRRHRTRRRHRWCPTAVRGDQVGRHRLPGVLGRSGAEVSGSRAVPPIRPRENSSISWAPGWRQGFVSNITNLKMLVFYLAVLPQFLGPHPSLPALVALGLSHAAPLCSTFSLSSPGLARVRRVFSRRPVRVHSMP